MSSDCSIYLKRVQDKILSPMPFIGLYAAIASLICALAVMLNPLYKELSFYCSLNYVNYSFSYFGLNVLLVTLLAVATKLTGDITSPNLSPRDNLAKVSSTVFLTMVMGNCFSTLGRMVCIDIIGNVISLGIFIFTVLVDLCIQLSTGALGYSLFWEIIIAMLLLFCMFITIVSSALAIPTIKKHAELTYQTMHKLASDEEQMEGKRNTVQELRLSIKKYYVMAASGNPQFLVTRLVTYVFTGNICLLSATLLYSAWGRSEYAFREWTSDHCHQESDYKWSVKLIVYSQLFAAFLLACIYLLIFLYIMRSTYEENGIKISRQEFTIESYWTEKLKEWRQSPIPIRIKRHVVRKLLHDIKSLILAFCIQVQTAIVMWCKLSRVVSFYAMLPFVFLLPDNKVPDDKTEVNIDHNCFVILLEGEKQLPTRLLRIIINRVDWHIKFGNKMQPQNLFNLLKEGFSFRGVIDFDGHQVPSLLSDEPPNCWTLPVVTLTSIAVALPNIASQQVDWLVSSVDEGLHYASIIDDQDDKHQLKHMRKAADVVWVGIELHKKWLDMDLERKTRKVNSAKEAIQSLADAAERIVMDFKSTQNKLLGENPLYLPVNVLAANSMYRISQTILLYYENSECQAEELFRKLTSMIADILAACLTNLPHYIANLCRCNAIERRERSVRKAASLLGKTEDILKLFEERQLSSIGSSHPFCIDEWRQWMKEQDPTVSESATSKGAPSAADANEHVVVEMQA